MRTLIYTACSIALIFAACKKDPAATSEKIEKKAHTAPGTERIGYQQVGAPGVEAQGADIAVTDINGNGIPDIFLLHHDAPTPGANEFRYQIAYDVNGSGSTSSYSGVKSLWSGVSAADGAGIAIGDIDRNGVPDLLLMTYDAPAGPNTFKYKIGFNLNANGDPATWSGFFTIPGVSYDGQGAGAALGDIDGNGVLDLLLVACDGRATGELRYQIAFNLNTGGQAATTLPNYVTVGHVAINNQGAGAALADLNGDGKQEAFFLGYDNPGGTNNFRLFGSTLNKQGYADVTFSPYHQFEGVCSEAQGAGIAIADIDLDGDKDAVFLAEDNPPGTNSFRYYVAYTVKKSRFDQSWYPRDIPQ